MAASEGIMLHRRTRRRMPGKVPDLYVHCEVVENPLLGF